LEGKLFVCFPPLGEVMDHWFMGIC
jgi:hypothetical protein